MAPRQEGEEKAEEEEEVKGKLDKDEEMASEGNHCYRGPGNEDGA